MRDGNPFHSITLDPRCQTSTVVDLASSIYGEKAFDRMPILADALMDAGCDSEEIIAHCRQSGEHVRGCWALDFALGQRMRGKPTLPARKPWLHFTASTFPRFPSGKKPVKGRNEQENRIKLPPAGNTIAEADKDARRSSMPTRQIGRMLQCLRSLDARAGIDLTDGQLLESFLDRGEHTALEAPGQPALAHGLGRMPAHLGQSSRCRGCVPGDVSCPGADVLLPSGPARWSGTGSTAVALPRWHSRPGPWRC